MNVLRSDPKCGTGLSADNFRQQYNSITSYIDASNVYGSTDEETKDLREAGGNGGDSRVNVVPSLASYHHLFVLEHNRIAKELFGSFPDNETVFQETRRILIAIMQKITYEEFLPSVLSHDTRVRYGLVSDVTHGYDVSVDATMINEFGIAYRFGHTWIPRTMDIFDRRLRRRPGLPSERTEDSYDDMTLYYENTNPDGPSGLAYWLSGENSTETDNIVERAAQTFLFKNDAAGTAFDLVSLNIQRGRDHGIPGYTKYMEKCAQEKGITLDPVLTFQDLQFHTSEVQNKYGEIYNILNYSYNKKTSIFCWDIDLFTGLLTEKPTVTGTDVGPTLECILGTQFQKLKIGDRYWYEGATADFSGDQLGAIKSYTMAKLLCNNYNFREVNFPSAFNATHPLVRCNSNTIPDLEISKFTPPSPTTTPTPPPAQNGPGGPGGNGGGPGGNGGGPGGNGGGPGGNSGGPGGNPGPGGPNKREKEMNEILTELELEAVLDALVDDLEEK